MKITVTFSRSGNSYVWEGQTKEQVDKMLANFVRIQDEIGFNTLKIVVEQD